jgi:WD40 repeat protein
VAGHERIYLYDLAKPAPAGELAFPEGVPTACASAAMEPPCWPAGAAACNPAKVLFDVRTGNRIAVIGQEMDVVLAAEISADGKLVALGGPGKLVKIFSVPDGKLLFQSAKHTDWITALEFSPDGARLATGDRAGGILVWESATGGGLGALSEHKDAITSLSWRGDGQLLASASEDDQIIVWNVNDGFPLASFCRKTIESKMSYIDFQDTLPLLFVSFRKVNLYGGWVKPWRSILGGFLRPDRAGFAENAWVLA